MNKLKFCFLYSQWQLEMMDDLIKMSSLKFNTKQRPELRSNRGE